MDKPEFSKLIGLALQHDHSNFEEKPGIKKKVSVFYSPHMARSLADENFVNASIAAYKGYSNLSPEQCAKIAIGVDSVEMEPAFHYFTVRFRNSNNPIFKDLQEHLILKIGQKSIFVCESVLKEKVVEIKLEEIINWGINHDLIVLCYGDKYDVTKLYFQVYNPVDVAEILFNYGNQLKSGEAFDYLAKHESVGKFVVNTKTRRSNVFSLK